VNRSWRSIKTIIARNQPVIECRILEESSIVPVVSALRSGCFCPITPDIGLFLIWVIIIIISDSWHLWNCQILGVFPAKLAV